MSALDSMSRLAAALADRYRLERELGQGGMATVYLARDLKHERQGAPNYAVSADGRRFLMMESTALPALKSLDLVLLEHWVQGIPQEDAR